MPALKDILSKKTDQQLMYYVAHPDKHTETAVQLALEELNIREVIIPESILKVLAERTIKTEYVLSKETRKKLYYQSLIISLTYVGLGTVSVLGLYPDSIFYEYLGGYTLLITLPVNFISFAAGMAGTGTDISNILIIQTIMFLLFWFILFNFLKLRKQRAPT